MRKNIFLAIVAFNIIIWTALSLIPPNKTTKSKSTEIQFYQENTDTVKTTIGRKVIFLPSPSGWYEASSNNPDVLSKFKENTMKVAKFIAVFILLENKEHPDFLKNVTITTQKAIENNTVHNTDFLWYKSELESQMNLILDEYKSGFGKGDLGVEKKLNFKIDNMTPIGVFLNKDNAIAMATIIRFESTEVDGVFGEMIVGAATVLVKGKMLNIQVSSPYKAEGDIAWVRAVTNEFVDLILSAN
jgi:hypothetical protein